MSTARKIPSNNLTLSIDTPGNSFETARWINSDIRAIIVAEAMRWYAAAIVVKSNDLSFVVLL